MAQSQAFYTGNEIFENLTSGEPQRLVFAYGFIAGVWDTQSNNGKTICTNSQKVTLKQLTSVVEKYMKDFPERRGYSAYSIVGAAFQIAFPCGKGQ